MHDFAALGVSTPCREATDARVNSLLQQKNFVVEAMAKGRARAYTFSSREK
jgi:hypothetical protein